MKLKMLFLCLVSLVFNSVMGATVGHTVGIDPMAGAMGANVIAAVGGAFGMMPTGVARAGVLTEVWTGELIKYLRRGLEATFLDGIPDASSLANNDVIHLVDVGVDPDVLVNNTTYPIPLQALDDTDKTISLDKFQSKVTPVTDDELYALSYDKMTRVKESHGNAINDAKFAKAVCELEQRDHSRAYHHWRARCRDRSPEADDAGRDQNEARDGQAEGTEPEPPSGSVQRPRERPAGDEPDL